MKWGNGCILILIMAMILVGCGQERATHHQVSYLPYLEKGMTLTPSSTISPTVTSSAKTPHPTSTRPANPYYPIVKTLIDVHDVRDVAVNTKTGVAYARIGLNELLPIRNRIPDFDHTLEIPPETGDILIDEQRDKMYVMAESYAEPVTHGVSIFYKDEFIKYIPFPGMLSGMVLERKKGWLYLYGIPNIHDPELGNSVAGILVIIDGVNVIETIKPWEIYPNKAIGDPSTGQIYFASQYTPESPRTDTALPYGRIDVYQGSENIATVIDLFTPVTAFVYNPLNQVIYGYTARYGEEYPYDMTIFQKGNLISHETVGPFGSISAGVIHPITKELYLVDGEKLHIMTGEVVPQWKKSVQLTGKDVGFQQIIADPFSGNVYLNNWYDGTLTIIHDEEIIGVMQLNRDLSDMALNPNNGDLYLSNGHTGHIWILGFDEQTVFPK